MIHRDYQPPDDTAWFDRWKQRAAEALRVVLEENAAAEKDDRKAANVFNREVYGALKSHLMKRFKNKCAYCEGNCEEAHAYFEVEHYRPKRAVDGVPVHLGYYWLAYEPTNLLLSCPRCNQGDAKRNHFPLSDPACRAYRPGDPIDQEDPLLLNPYRHEPNDHLLFHRRIGTVEVKNQSRYGETSIEVYRLNRSGLVKARRKSQKFYWMQLMDMLTSEQIDEAKQVYKEIFAGDVEYSASVRAHVAPLRDFADFVRETEESY